VLQLVDFQITALKVSVDNQRHCNVVCCSVLQCVAVC